MRDTPTFLHLEDDEVDQATVKRILRGLNCSLIQVKTVAEALKVCAQRNILLCFCDINVPDSSNPVPQLQRALPQGTKIVVLSGSPNPAPGLHAIPKPGAASPLTRASKIQIDILELALAAIEEAEGDDNEA